MIRIVRPLVLPAILCLFAAPASAQMFSYGGYEGRATQALSFTTHFIDFDYDGDGDPETRLDWDGNAYGFTFDRQNVTASLVFGRAESIDETLSEKLSLVDASLIAWADVVRSRGTTATLGVPIVIHSGFRSIDGDFVDDLAESFSYTVLGIGTGITAGFEPARTISVNARVWPAITMAFRSFEGFAGSSTLLDADLQAHFMNLFGRYGLSAGYGFRWQKWNTNDSGLVQDVDDNLFDYKTSQHMLRLGLNW